MKLQESSSTNLYSSQIQASVLVCTLEGYIFLLKFRGSKGIHAFLGGNCKPDQFTPSELGAHQAQDPALPRSPSPNLPKLAPKTRLGWCSHERSQSRSDRTGAKALPWGWANANICAIPTALSMPNNQRRRNLQGWAV